MSLRRLSVLVAVFAMLTAYFAGAARAEVFDPELTPAGTTASLSPSIASDQGDYPPGGLVTLTGGNWQPGEVVHIHVNDDQGATWTRDVDVTADESGLIYDQFNLPEWFVAHYDVVATGASGTATTDFTDGNTTYSPTRVPAAGLQDVDAGENLDFTIATRRTTGGGNPVIEDIVVGTNTTCGGTDPQDLPPGWVSITSPALPVTITSTTTDTNFEFRVAVPAGTAAGDYTAQVKYDVAPGAGSAAGFALCVHVVAAQDQVVTLTAATPQVYGTDFSVSSSSTSGLTAFTYSTSGACSNTGATIHPTGVGDCVITSTQAGDSSWNADSDEKTVVIQPKPIDVSFTAPDKVYNQSAAATIESPALDTAAIVGTDAVTLDSSSATASFSDANAGDGKTVTATGFSLAGAQAGRYVISTPVTTTANITRKGVTGSFTAADKTYDATAVAAVTGTPGLTGVLDGDAVTLNAGAATFDTPDVGDDKPVSAGLGWNLSGTSAANYSLTSVSDAAADVTKATLTVTASSPADITYGDPAPASSPEYGAFQGTDDADDLDTAPSCATSYVAGDPVGPYSTSCSGGEDDNYAFDYLGGSFDVGQKTLVPSFTADDKVYDATTAATVATRSLATVLAADAADVSFGGGTVVFDDANVGSAKTVTWSGFALAGAGSGNYVLSTTEITDEANVTKATLTVTASSPADITYGDPAPASSPEYGAFQGTDDADDLDTAPSCATSYVAGDPVGPYSTSCSGGEDDNYAFDYLGGSFDVGQKTLVPSFTADDKVYDATTAATVATRSLATVLAADAADVSFGGGTVVFDDANVGSAKTVTWSGFALAGAGSGNYVLSTTEITDEADITQRDLEVSADPQSKVYGDPDPALSHQVTSGALQGSDELSGALDRDPGQSVAGSPYAITQGTLTAGPNYNLSFVGDELEITQRPVTVTAADKSKVYGDDDPALTASVTTGSLAFDDELSGALTRDAGESVTGSPYAITQGTLTAGPNYDMTFEPGELTITKRALKVAATDKVKVLNAADPALTYTFTDGTSLVNGDALLGNLTRDPGEGIGSYPITQGTLAATNDYDMTFANGTLKIVYSSAATCLGSPNRQILPPVNTDATSVFKKGSTVPLKFRVCDANGASVGTPGVVARFERIAAWEADSTVLNEQIYSTTPDTAFRWSASDQQWIFNLSTKTLQAGNTYYYKVTLNDGNYLPTFGFTVK